jgi:hypothetical protein
VLTGWRAGLSFILEVRYQGEGRECGAADAELRGGGGGQVADVAVPLVQRMGTQLSSILSWVLVRLIGRSLGLVYRGIRQSLTSRPA